MARWDLRPGLFALLRLYLESSMLCDATSCHQPVPRPATTIEACSHCAFLHFQNIHTSDPLYTATPYCIPYLDCPCCTHDTRRRTHNTTSPSFVKPTRLQPPSRCLPTTLMSTSSTRTASRLSTARSVSPSGGHRPRPHPAPPRRYHGRTSLSSLLMCVPPPPDTSRIFISKRVLNRVYCL